MKRLKKTISIFTLGLIGIIAPCQLAVAGDLPWYEVGDDWVTGDIPNLEGYSLLAAAKMPDYMSEHSEAGYILLHNECEAFYCEVGDISGEWRGSHVKETIWGQLYFKPSVNNKPPTVKYNITFWSNFIYSAKDYSTNDLLGILRGNANATWTTNPFARLQNAKTEAEIVYLGTYYILVPTSEVQDFLDFGVPAGEIDRVLGDNK